MHASVDTAVLIRLSRTRRRHDGPYDAQLVIDRLEEAGRTLIALPGVGCGPGNYKAAWPEFPQLQAEAYGYTEEEQRPATPSAAAITRMDEAFGWVRLIPAQLDVPERGGALTRKLVLFRSLMNPVTERHRWPWRRLQARFGLGRETLRMQHADGIDKIVSCLQEDRRAAYLDR